MICKARLQITSLAFMLVDVPAPPWMTSTTNWSGECAGADFLAGGLDRVRWLGAQEAEFLLQVRAAAVFHRGQGGDEVSVFFKSWFL